MIPGKDFVGVGVGALILRGRKALMLLRSDRCRNNAGMWTVPGGMLETYEKLEDAVKREVSEETGLTVTGLKFMTVSDRIFDEQHWISIMYLCDVEGEPRNVEADKHSGIEWLDIDRLPDNVTTPSMDVITEYIRQSHDPVTPPGA